VICRENAVNLGYRRSRLLVLESRHQTWEALPQQTTRRRVAQAASAPAEPRRITREDVLTVADVAALLDLKPYTVKEYARRGILPGRKLGRTWRFLRPELEEAILGLPKAHA
jgi:excisionase family DNA binding protein